MLFVLLLSCRGCKETPEAVELFANPPELSPDENGVYQLNFAPTEVTINGERYCVRAYNDMIPGPTIRIAPGENRKIHVTLNNRFVTYDYREVSGMEGREEPACHDFNLTNLHFHGGHVQPNYATLDEDPCTGLGCGPDHQYYGDNVLIDVPQQFLARYRWDIDEDGPHHEGTDWYHPHIHGATAIQVINGAAGALIIEGPLDQLPEVAAATERVMMVAEIPYNHETTRPLSEGEACTDYNLSINNFLSVTEGMPILINGIARPTLKTVAGQVERWRMIYAGTPDEMGMTLHAGKEADCSVYSPENLMNFVQYARDGITMTQYYETDTTWVSPGYRVDAFLKMPDTPQTLCLVGRRTHDLSGSVIGIIQVEEGTPTLTDIPDQATVTALGPPVTWTGRVDGQTQTVSCDSVQTIHQKVGLLMQPTALPNATLVSDGGSCDGHDMGAVEEGPICECPSPNINCRKFENRRARGYRSDRVAVVGDSEKWQIMAFDGHPFHIHINPFVVCENNSNKEPNFPHWRDTFWVQLDDGPQEIITEFKRYTGSYVTHCHKLNHEDEGMMEVVEVCAEDDLECQCQRFEGEECVSQAGCQEDDYQCQYAEQVMDAWPLLPAPDPDFCHQ